MNMDLHGKKVVCIELEALTKTLDLANNCATFASPNTSASVIYAQLMEAIMESQDSQPNFTGEADVHDMAI